MPSRIDDITVDGHTYGFYARVESMEKARQATNRLREFGLRSVVRKSKNIFEDEILIYAERRF